MCLAQSSPTLQIEKKPVGNNTQFWKEGLKSYLGIHFSVALNEGFKDMARAYIFSLVPSRGVGGAAKTGQHLPNEELQKEALSVALMEIVPFS